jgi:RNA polymerase sigma-70 factor (ECF subfamily)
MGPTCPADEFTLVERAKSDPEAFGELYERYFDGIYAFAYARLNTRTEAEDATSEVFFKAMRGIRGYRPAGKPFKAWLYRIAANVIIDRRRRRRPTTALEEAVEAAIESPDVADTIVERVRMRSIWEAVDRLPQHQRIAVTLRFSADLSNRSIAGVMGKSAPAVKLLIYRGVRTLRDTVAADPVGPAAQGDFRARYV